MIHRHYLTCDVCQTHHTLRIQIGYSSEQSHCFPCHTCDEPITIEFPSKKNGERMVMKGAAIAAPATKTEYQYLSPDFVANKENAWNPLYCGSFDLMHRLIEAVGDNSVVDVDPPSDTWIALTDAFSDWQILQRSWRLTRSGNHYLATEQLAQLSVRDEEMAVTLWPSVFDFTSKLFGTDLGLMESVLDIHNNHPEEFSRFVTKYEYDWKDNLREGEFKVFGDFFKCWDAFSQVYLYVRAKIPLPETPIATSVNYDGVSGFYALAQEFYASQLILLTGLNNIKSGVQEWRIWYRS